MHEGTFRTDDLVRVTDRRRVECLGGPLDGEFRPIAENGRRRDGCYAVVNDASNRAIARQWVPDEEYGL